MEEDGYCVLCDHLDAPARSEIVIAPGKFQWVTSREISIKDFLRGKKRM
jgi:hypothetical protein